MSKRDDAYALCSQAYRLYLDLYEAYLNTGDKFPMSASQPTPPTVMSPGVGTILRYTYSPTASCIHCTDGVVHTMDVCNRILNVVVKGEHS